MYLYFPDTPRIFGVVRQYIRILKDLGSVTFIFAFRRLRKSYVILRQMIG